MENNQDDENQMGELDQSPRKKRRWGRRICVGLAIFLLAIVGLWFWMNARGDDAIQRELARYRAAGQPVDPEDFEPGPIDDEDNAAITLKRAAATIQLTPSQEDLVNEATPKLISQNLDEFCDIIETNREAFQLVHEARSKKGVDWGLDFHGDLTAIVLPGLSPQRDLARLVGASALYHHRIGNDSAAVETVRDALAASGKIGEIPTLIAHLVRVAIDSLMISRIETISHDLKISDVGSDGSATREQVKVLIDELLDEDTLRRGLQMAFYGERLFALDMGERTLKRKSSPGQTGLTGPGNPSLTAFGGVAARVFSPVLKEDLVRILEWDTALAEAAAQSSYPAAKAKFPLRPKVESFFDQARHMLSSILMTSCSRLFVLHFRAMAMRRMCAVALAIRMYEVDNGKRPEKLSDLVPKYLPAVSEDPFAADGRPITYLPNAPRPLLYSIGDNGIDQGGAQGRTPDSPPDWDNFDLPFFLDGDRPRLPRTSTTQPTSAPTSTDP